MIMAQGILPGVPLNPMGGELEFWETPPMATHAVIPFLPRRLFGRCFLIEPTAGHGAILDVAIPALLPISWLAYEIDEDRCRELCRRRETWPTMAKDTVFQADFLTSTVAELPGAARADVPWLFLGNPPYAIGTQVVEKCCRLADAPADPALKGVVAMLLQHDFATGVDRCERIHSKWKSSLHPLKRRPSFGDDGTGKRPFSWFIFDLAEPKSEWGPIG